MNTGSWTHRIRQAAVAAAVTALGVAGFGSAGEAAGEPWLFDTDGDGVYDTVRIDHHGDGVADAVAVDGNQNGVVESIRLDRDNDGWLELSAVDSQENGVIDWVGIDSDLDGAWDTIVQDYDENGTDDFSQWEYVSGGVSIVGGPVTNPDWFYSLMMQLAGEVGPTFGTPDSDHDGYSDNVDAAPGDPYRA